MSVNVGPVGITLKVCFTGFSLVLRFLHDTELLYYFLRISPLSLQHQDEDDFQWHRGEQPPLSGHGRRPRRRILLLQRRQPGKSRAFIAHPQW